MAESDSPACAAWMEGLVSRPSYFGRFLGNFSGSVVVAAACGRFRKNFSNIARRVNFEYNFGKSSPPPNRTADTRYIYIY